MEINLYTDIHEFCYRVKENITYFIDAHPTHSSRSEMYVQFAGACDIKNKVIFINLPHIRKLAFNVPFDIIEIISNTIMHEVVHCVIEEIGEENSTVRSEAIIRTHIDEVQHYFTFLNKKIRDTQKILWTQPK